MSTYAPIEVKVWGDFACFTRPEMKVERVSYEVMTPSAARGVLESIFWKPEFQWCVREIHVLRPIRYYSLVRNEVNHRAVYRTARQRLEQGKGGYIASDEKNRAQRHTLCLRDVAYLIVADIALRTNVQEDPAKYRDQFRRRVGRGQCYIAPYLGCREFAASFGERNKGDVPQTLNMHLGRMLFDLEYMNDGSGRGRPRFFPASLENGVLRIPEILYEKEL